MAKAVSDGSRLNFAAALAQTAADVQALSARRVPPNTSDDILLAVRDDLRTAVESLCSAVTRLAVTPGDDDET